MAIIHGRIYASSGQNSLYAPPTEMLHPSLLLLAVSILAADALHTFPTPPALKPPGMALLGSDATGSMRQIPAVHPLRGGGPLLGGGSADNDLAVKFLYFSCFVATANSMVRLR